MTVDIEQALTPITQAQRMLAEAKTLPQLRELRDFATGAKAWAKARGLGVDAENEAAEVILRAERMIGAALIRLIDEDLLFRPGTGDGGNQFIEPAGNKMGLGDLGLTKMDSSRFQSLARLSDEQFEGLLSAGRTGGLRLAKFNFYNAIKQVEKREREPYAAEAATREDSAFLTFRAGAHALLGWQVDEQGIGHVTANGLRLLPDDELVQVATLIKRLAEAYNEAKAARG